MKKSWKTGVCFLIGCSVRNEEKVMITEERKWIEIFTSASKCDYSAWYFIKRGQISPLFKDFNGKTRTIYHWECEIPSNISEFAFRRHLFEILCTMEEEKFWIIESIYVPVLQEELYPSLGFKVHLYDTLLDTMTFVYSFKQLEARFFLTVWNKTLPPGQTTYYSKSRKIFNLQSAKSFGIL